MSLFHDAVCNDIKNTFLNLAEFAQIIKINGRDMTAVLDDEQLSTTQVSSRVHNRESIQGIYTDQKLLYVSAEEYGKLPVVGRRIDINGDMYLVNGAVSNCGMYEITLKEIDS